jgi:hypothetical protein
VEKAIDEFFVDKPETVIPIPDKCGTAVIRKIGECARTMTNGNADKDADITW